MTRVQWIALLFALSVWAAAARGSDGVLEINQTCAVETGCFPGDFLRFPVTITQAGSYRLTGNLVVPDENTGAIFVGANSPGSRRASNSVVDRSIARLNGGLGISAADDSVVVSCATAFNGASGIYASDGMLSGNVATSSGLFGILIGGSTLTGNVASHNRSDGIRVNGPATLSGNTTNSNATLGPPYDEDGVECSGTCNVQSRTASLNGGYGLNLGSDAGYGQSFMVNNGAGGVSGGVKLGANHCAGVGVGVPACP